MSFPVSREMCESKKINAKRRARPPFYPMRFLFLPSINRRIQNDWRQYESGVIEQPVRNNMITNNNKSMVIFTHTFDGLAL